jgi:hypothetical protein
MKTAINLKMAYVKKVYNILDDTNKSIANFHETITLNHGKWEVIEVIKIKIGFLHHSGYYFIFMYFIYAQET